MVVKSSHRTVIICHHHIQMLNVAFANAEVDEYSTTFTSSTHTSAHYVDINEICRRNRVIPIAMQRWKYLRLAWKTPHTVFAFCFITWK